MTLIDHLDISTGSVVAVIGCGGKTSLISLLAGKLRNKKVLGRVHAKEKRQNNR
jgi:ABC-type hemin transport system ATPase subunit